MYECKAERREKEGSSLSAETLALRHARSVRFICVSARSATGLIQKTAESGRGCTTRRGVTISLMKDTT